MAAELGRRSGCRRGRRPRCHAGSGSYGDSPDIGVRVPTLDLAVALPVPSLPVALMSSAAGALVRAGTDGWRHAVCRVGGGAAAVTAEDFLVVDCLLPTQIRRL